VDFVATNDPRPGLRTVFRVLPADPNAGPPVVVAVPEVARRLRRVPVAPSGVKVSENEARVPDMLDGNLETRWETVGPQVPGTWIEMRLSDPRPLAAVELALGRRARLFAANLHLFTLGADGSWERLAVVDGRPSWEQQKGRQPSQLLLFAATPTRGIRLLQVGRRVRPWSVAELRLFEEPAGP